MIHTDYFGNQINVGDELLYIGNVYASTILATAKCVGFTERYLKMESDYAFKILSSKTIKKGSW